jgi:hypothetical protein
MKTTPPEEFTRLAEVAAHSYALDDVIIPPAEIAAAAAEMVREEAANPGSFTAPGGRISAECAATLQ